MLVKNLNEIENVDINMDGVKNVKKKIAIGKNDGSPTMAFRVFTIEPGGHTPYHSHEQEHVNYVIEGEGALVDENGNEKPLKAGDFALVLPNEKHQYKNNGNGNFVMICAVKKEYE
ncbi:MAG: cupin domain-containing protein [Ignavibacteria bacterium]|nr:MAG: cupin domain-containing protein [Ignavibacteria bacterium]